ncbi:MAG TPA: 50S ribosomal protein L25, partial [Candidatus Moranbacteria bacterium]|nr:50S ribosomal protein L25 [Candidatus Moranbacteria bacterium]
MSKIALKATKREVLGKRLQKSRKEGLIPAVLYGHGIANENLWIKYLDFSRAYEKAGENSIIEIEIGDKQMPVLVYDTQTDTMSGKFSHIDFLQVNMKEEVEAKIPLEFVGES